MRSGRCRLYDFQAQPDVADTLTFAARTPDDGSPVLAASGQLTNWSNGVRGAGGLGEHAFRFHRFVAPTTWHPAHRGMFMGSVAVRGLSTRKRAAR